MARSTDKPAGRKHRTGTPQEAATQAAPAHTDTEAGERETGVAKSTAPLVEPPPAPDMTAMEHLCRLVEAVDRLIASSLGVYGLHANGDMAPWPSLRRGGEHSAWLEALDEAKALSAEADQILR